MTMITAESRRDWTLSFAAIIAMLLLLISQYGDRRAAEALAQQRLEQLTAEREAKEASWLERDRVNASLDSALAGSQAIRDSLDVLYASADSSAQSDVQTLAPVLAAIPELPDSVLEQINRTIRGLEVQIGLCERRLTLRDSDKLLYQQQLVISDSTEGDLRGLLDEYEVQLNDAIKNRRRPAGVLRWVERGLAGYAIVDLVRSLLGGQ